MNRGGFGGVAGGAGGNVVVPGARTGMMIGGGTAPGGSRAGTAGRFDTERALNETVEAALGGGRGKGMDHRRGAAGRAGLAVGAGTDEWQDGDMDIRSARQVRSIYTLLIVYIYMFFARV